MRQLNQIEELCVNGGASAEELTNNFLTPITDAVKQVVDSLKNLFAIVKTSFENLFNALKPAPKDNDAAAK